MGYKITWSPEAADDLDDIFEFYRKRDPYYGQSVVEELLTRSDKLSYFPLRGRNVPELEGSDYRELFSNSYRMIFRVEDTNVYIIAVVTSRMPLDVERFDS